MNKDIKNYFNSIWSKNHQVVVAPPQSTDFANFTYCGCGFVVQYKGYKFLVLIYISTLENLRKAGVGKSSNQSFLFI